MHSTLTTELFKVFCKETSCIPLMSLRAGNAIDDYATPMLFEYEHDQVSDEYFENFHWGLSYLDPSSWRHYLPYLLQYSFRRIQEGSVVIDSLLSSLRPPDRMPPRLGSLSAEQETATRQAIEYLAFAKDSVHAEFACQVLEEWWLPNSIYRPATE